MDRAALKKHLNHQEKKRSVHIAMATNLTTIQKVMEISSRADKISARIMGKQCFKKQSEPFMMSSRQSGSHGGWIIIQQQLNEP